MVADENAAYIVPPGDEAALAQALARLAGDAAARHTIGKANRIRAAALYDERRMIDAYRAIYGGVSGRPEL